MPAPKRKKPQPEPKASTYKPGIKVPLHSKRLGVRKPQNPGDDMGWYADPATMEKLQKGPKGA